MSDKKGFDPKYDDLKKEKVFYLGRRPEGENYRRLEVINNYIDGFIENKRETEEESVPVEFGIKDSIVLHTSNSGQQKIFCWLLESNGIKSISAVHISRRTKKGVYGSEEITLTGEAAMLLRTFLNKFHYIDTSRNEPFSVPVSEIDVPIFTPQILSEDQFSELIRVNITNTDDFYKLLSVQKKELAIERLRDIIAGDFENEVDIQKFLKENVWMFGNDYTFVIEENKINAKNILDIAPRNFESYVDIIEVKLPNETLFHFDSSHNNYYSASKLTKAIAQTQNYLFELEKMTTNERYQKDNNCAIIRPQGIVLFGSATDLNEDEKTYLRILNASYHNIKIITYQQLLEKAKNSIVFTKSNME